MKKTTAPRTYKTPVGKAPGLYVDMLNQVHILVGGATGSGKSVVINGMMHTALYDSPAKVEFVLIDPKRVELVKYRDLPHTLRYASEPEDMVNALRYAINLVDARYRYMQAHGLTKFPGGAVWVVIDELADLMTTNGKAVTPIIQRLCQIGRAAKVHVLAATQCPLAKVIPTEIKVNFDTVMALRTATAQHSRNLMSATGCERLPRYGKAYYITPDGRELVNVPMVADTERERILKFWQGVERITATPAPTKKPLLKRLFA